MLRFIETKPGVFNLQSNHKDKRGNWYTQLHDIGVSRVRQGLWVAIDASAETSELYPRCGAAIAALGLQSHLGYEVCDAYGNCIANGAC